MGAAIVKPALLLDSAVLIDHLRGIRKATEWLAALNEGEAVISVITRAELLCGRYEDERASAVRLCATFECLSITPDIADTAADLRREHRWKLPDAFQAALALQHGLKLVTRNTKDFAPDRHDFVVVPYSS
jgi:predicted nucleic acid-binding protein